MLFLSTPSARRATYSRCTSCTARPNFYPRPPRGGRRCSARPWPQASTISIHALREEGDSSGPSETSPLEVFLSTPSARRATQMGLNTMETYLISIHALREEGDVLDLLHQVRQVGFLSTPSARRATWPPVSTSSMYSNFYPRPPRGGRHQNLKFAASQDRQFLSTPSARRATQRHGPPWQTAFYFYPRPPRGGRHCTSIIYKCIFKFLSTPSARRATAEVDSLFVEW